MRTSLYIEKGFLNVDRTSLNIERASLNGPQCRQNWQQAEAKSEFDGKHVTDMLIMAQAYRYASKYTFYLRVLFN